MLAWQVLQGTVSIASATPFCTAKGEWQLVQTGDNVFPARIRAACTLVCHSLDCCVWQVWQPCTIFSENSRRLLITGIAAGCAGRLISVWQPVQPSGLWIECSN